MSGNEGLYSFQIKKEFHQNSRYRWFRATLTATGQSVVLKQLKESNPDLESSRLIKHEFALNRRFSTERICPVYGLESLNGRLTLILADCGEAHLGKLIAKGPVAQDHFLKLATQLAEALFKTHQQNILFQNLEPKHLLLGPSGLVLTDFSRSLDLGGLNKEGAIFSPKNSVNIAYQAPEQTGRLERVVDLRADLYSLGVVFYQMLTGKLPFAGTDPDLILHAKLTSSPASLDKHQPELDPLLYSLVSKLLEVNPDNRYQTTAGLLTDLKNLGREAPPNIRISDHPAQLIFSNYLYGRETESRQLEAWIREIPGSEARLVQIVGPSGGGKNSLVARLEPLIRKQGGRFLKGGFHPPTGQAGEEALLEAFSGWINEALIEPKAVVLRLKQKVSSVLDGDQELLRKLLPRLELLLGPSEHNVETSSPERLGQALARLAEGLISEYGFLVVSLGNLQWARPDQLKIINAFLRKAPKGLLCLIRSQTPIELPKPRAGFRVETIHLGNLNLATIEELLSDLLTKPTSEVLPLATLTLERTQGNPLLIMDFLAQLYNQKLIYQNPESGWKWDLAGANRYIDSKNRIGILEIRLHDLGPELNQLLQIASTLGESFDLNQLCVLALSSEAQLKGKLAPAVERGILVLEPTGYRFHHEQIQHHLYQSLDPVQAGQTHLALAADLQYRFPDFQSGPKLFDILSHFNQAQALLRLPLERLELARLNLLAATLSLDSGQPAQSVSWCDAGLLALKEVTDPLADELALDISWQRATCLFSLGQIEEFDRDLTLLMGRHQGKALARLGLLRIRHMALLQQPEGVCMALSQGLKELGITFPFDTQAAQLALKQVRGLKEEALDSSEALLASQLLAESLPCLSGGHLVWFELALILLERLSFKKNQPAFLGLVRWGQASLAFEANQPNDAETRVDQLSQLISTLPSGPQRHQLNLLYQANLRPWTEPWAPLALELWSVLEPLLINKDWFFGNLALKWRNDLLLDKDPVGAKDDSRQILELYKEGAPYLGGLYDWFVEEPKTLLDPFRRELLGALRAYISEEMEDATASLKRAHECRPALLGAPLSVLFAFLQAKMELAQPKENASGYTYLEKLSQFVPGAAVPYLLIQAETAWAKKDASEARDLFETTLERADRIGQVMYEMTTSETYGRMAWRLNQPRKARGLIDIALALAQNWGPEFKIKNLEHLRAKFFPDLSSLPRVRGPLAPTEGIDQEQLFESLLAISQEIDQERLPRRILERILAYAGAEKGLLFFGDQGRSRLVSAMCSVGGRIKDAWSIDKEKNGELYSEAITRFVFRTGEELILTHACEQGPFIIDPYVQNQQVLSVYCTPFASNGEPLGLLYLENNQIPDAFGKGRLKALKIILAQAAIAWEKAGLYHRQLVLVDRLKDMDRLKDEFLAGTSHELRTPLAGIIGLSEMMLESTNLEDQTKRNQLRLIIQSGKRLSGLINDILDFSLIKEQRLRLRLIPIDLHRLTANLMVLCRPLIGEKPLELVNLISPEISTVAADENRLQQILYNLLGNAIKFCAKGRIEIRAEEIQGQMKVSVTDTGIGIEAERLERIFDAFAGHNHSKNPIEGAGMGLALAWQLVRLHGGTIWAESVLGKGSSFFFTLPLHQEKAFVLEPIKEPENDWIDPEWLLLDESPRPEKPEARILVVEDDPILAKTISQYLAGQNFWCQLALGGQEALDVLATDEPFDLVLLDLMLPGMDGFEVCRRIRENFDAARLPVIILTARAGTDDLLKGFKQGANDYLVKPVQPNELLARVKAQIEVRVSLERLEQNRLLAKEIEKRQNAEAELKTKQRQLLRLFDDLALPVLGLDAKLKLVLLNQKAESLLGINNLTHETHFLTDLIADLVWPLPEEGLSVRLKSGEGGTFYLLLHSISAEGFLLSLTQGASTPGQLNALKNFGEFASASGGQLLSQVRSLPARLDQSEFNRYNQVVADELRQKMVELMNLSLRYWSQTTGLTKVDLAEQSGIWNATVDKNGTFRTRTLDRYLKYSGFPDKPRWRDVLQTAYYCLQNCPEQAAALRLELEAELRYLEQRLSFM